MYKIHVTLSESETKSEKARGDITNVRRKTLKVFIKYKPTKRTFPKLIFQFLIV